MDKYTFNAVINKRRNQYYAFCSEVPTDAWADSSAAALARLQQETRLYLEEYPAPNYGGPVTKPLAVAVRDCDDTIRHYNFIAIVHREDNQFVADCPEVGSSSFSDSVEKALARLKEATELQLQDAPLPRYSKPQIIKY